MFLPLTAHKCILVHLRNELYCICEGRVDFGSILGSPEHQKNDPKWKGNIDKNHFRSSLGPLWDHLGRPNAFFPSNGLNLGFILKPSGLDFGSTLEQFFNFCSKQASKTARKQEDKTATQQPNNQTIWLGGMHEALKSFHTNVSQHCFNCFHKSLTFHSPTGFAFGVLTVLEELVPVPRLPGSATRVLSASAERRKFSKVPQWFS